jgi:hypothetical protein
MAIENPFKNLSKPQLYAIVGGSVLIGGYIVVHHHSTSGSWNPFSSGTATTAATSGGTAASIDPVTGLPYSEDDATDPTTGLEYLAEAQEYGSVSAADSSVSAYGASTATGSGIPVNSASPASTGSVNTVTGSVIYTSNAAWAQAAEAGLTDVGYASTDVATALGAYLTGEPVTSTEASLISVAVSEYGAPPVGTFQIILQPTTSTGTTTPPSTTPQYTTVPNLEKGENAGEVHNAIVVAGLTPVAAAGQQARWIVASTSPSGGTKVLKGSRVIINATATT